MNKDLAWLSLAPSACTDQWQLTDQRLVRYTQIIMVWLLCALTLTGESMQSYLQNNLSQLLGSDLVIELDHPLASSDFDYLSASSRTVSETSIAVINLAFQDDWQRTQLKVVDDNYPVQGQVTISNAIGATAKHQQSGPAPGNIWLGPRLASSLGVTPGDNIQIGTAELVFSALLVHEPDRLLEGHTVEMRAMVHKDSSPLLEPGQHRYRYLIVAAETERLNLTHWVQNNFSGAKVLDRHQGRHPLSAYWHRIQNFLGLSSIVLLLMAAVAICLANRRRVEEQQYRLALLLSMGLPLHRGVALLALEWLLPFIATLPIALGLAYLTQWLAVEHLQNQFPGVVASGHIEPVLQTVFLCLALLFLLQLPMLLTLRKTSIALLVKRVSQPVKITSQWLFAALSIALLAFSYSDNWRLTLMLLTSVVITIALLLLLSWAALWCGQKLTSKKPGLSGFSFFMLYQQRWTKSAQVIGLGVSLMLLLFSLVLSDDIRDSMISQTRQLNGNLLITDASTAEMSALKTFLTTSESHLRHERAFIDARVVSINDARVEDFISQPSEASARLERPIRLAWSDAVPSNNEITAGQWWQTEASNWHQLSVEDEVMTDLGLQLGDKLTLLIRDRSETFEIVASHQFKSGASNMTFWFQGPPGIADEFASDIRWMCSAELIDSAWPGLAQVAADNPGMILMPLKILTERFDQTLEIVVQSTLGFAAMVLVMTLLVGAASIISSQADDRKRNGLLRSFGLHQSDCRRLAIYEWALTGLIAAGGAVLGTCVSGTLIYQSELAMTYEPDWLWLITAAACTTLCIIFLGVIGTRRHRETGIRVLLAE